MNKNYEKLVQLISSEFNTTNCNKLLLVSIILYSSQWVYIHRVPNRTNYDIKKKKNRLLFLFIVVDPSSKSKCNTSTPRAQCEGGGSYFFL